MSVPLVAPRDVSPLFPRAKTVTNNDTVTRALVRILSPTIQRQHKRLKLRTISVSTTPTATKRQWQHAPKCAYIDPRALLRNHAIQ